MVLQHDIGLKSLKTEALGDLGTKVIRVWFTSVRILPELKKECIALQISVPIISQHLVLELCLVTFEIEMLVFYHWRHFY